jgi:4,5-DOPA dioxygenase extradiol
MMDWKNIDAQPYDWAIEFDHFVKKQVDERNVKALINYFGASAMLSIPTSEY